MHWTDVIVKFPSAPAAIRQLRSFGLIVGGVFLLLGAWPLLRHGQDLRMWGFAPGVLLVLAALIAPQALQYPYRIWMLLGHALGWINTRIILSVVFVLVFVPVAVVMRVIGRDAMQRRPEPDADTYRIVKSPREASHMNHQF